MSEQQRHTGLVFGAILTGGAGILAACGGGSTDHPSGMTPIASEVTTRHDAASVHRLLATTTPTPTPIMTPTPHPTPTPTATPTWSPIHVKPSTLILTPSSFGMVTISQTQGKDHFVDFIVTQGPACIPLASVNPSYNEIWVNTYDKLGTCSITVTGGGGKSTKIKLRVIE